jgi:hypothetical protein
MDKLKIYNLKQIQGACIIGSPLVAGILIAHNYKTFGESRKSMLWVLTGILWTLLLVALAFAIPEKFNRSAGMVIPFLNGALLYPIINRLQGKRIKEHFDNHGEKASNWLIAGLTILVAAMILVPVIVLDTMSPINGLKRQAFGTNGIYYNHDMPLEEVNQLGGILKRVEYFNPESVAEVIFLSNDSAYEMKLLVDKPALDDTLFVRYAEELFNHVNGYRFRKPLQFITTDTYLKDDRIVELDSNEVYAALAETEVFAGNPKFKLYYNKSVEKTEREKFQQLILEMNHIFPPQNPFDFIMDYEDGAYSLRLFVPKQSWADPRLLAEAKYCKEKLNHYGFVYPFKFILVDNTTDEIEEKEIE